MSASTSSAEAPSKKLRAAPSDGAPASWCQPNAKVPKHPQVTAFLRGPARTLTYTGPEPDGFANFLHAKNWAQKHFRSAIGAYNSKECHSATAEPGTKGGVAYCIVTKTRAACE